MTGRLKISPSQKWQRVDGRGWYSRRVGWFVDEGELKRYQSACCAGRTWFRLVPGGPLMVVRSTGDRQDRPSNTRRGVKKCGVDCWGINRKDTPHLLYLNNNVTTLISLILLIILLYDRELWLSDRQSLRVPIPELCAREEKTSTTPWQNCPASYGQPRFLLKQTIGMGRLSTGHDRVWDLNQRAFFYKRLGKWKRLFWRQRDFLSKENGARSDTIHPR